VSLETSRGGASERSSRDGLADPDQNQQAVSAEQSFAQTVEVELERSSGGEEGRGGILDWRQNARLCCTVYCRCR